MTCRILDHSFCAQYLYIMSYQPRPILRECGQSWFLHATTEFLLSDQSFLNAKEDKSLQTKVTQQ